MNIEELYKAIAPRLTAYLVANGTDYATACDIVQETFLRIWRLRDELVVDRSQISGLAYMIARNLRTDRFRKASHEMLVDEIREEEGSVCFPKETSDDRAYLRRRVCAALAQLPATLREAYTLFQIQEMSIREIAVWTGTSEASVKTRIFRAKRKLRPMLEDLLQTTAR
ncbi:MAG: RNA polymerase sigma factor [bacterium]|nr:RNA polymerase sigma factor [bacterium]